MPSDIVIRCRALEADCENPSAPLTSCVTLGKSLQSLCASVSSSINEDDKDIYLKISL